MDFFTTDHKGITIKIFYDAANNYCGNDYGVDDEFCEECLEQYLVLVSDKVRDDAKNDDSFSGE